MGLGPKTILDRAEARRRPVWPGVVALWAALSTYMASEAVFHGDPESGGIAVFFLFFGASLLLTLDAFRRGSVAGCCLAGVAVFILVVLTSLILNQSFRR